MTTKQREAAALREDFMRLAGRTFRMGYEAVLQKNTTLAKKAQTLYNDCLVGAVKCRRLDKLAAKLR